MSEIGIIGQIYEDRRTKKQGKLIERDNKFKTLLMESEDGKSFNITFGGFKSNWRKVDEPEQTVEEAMQEELPEESESSEQIVAEKPIKEEVISDTPKVRKKQEPRDVNPVLESTMLQILDYAKSFKNPRINTNIMPQKRSINVKVDNRRMFILTYLARKNAFQMCVREDLFLIVKDKKYVSVAKYNDNWQSMKYSFNVDVSDLHKFLDDARDYIVEYLSGDIKEEDE